MGVASWCGEQEACVASGSGWNIWVWQLGVVVKRYMYINFLILLIPIPLVYICSFLQQRPYFQFIFFMFSVLVYYNNYIGNYYNQQL